MRRGRNILEKVKVFDILPKEKEEVKEKSTAGAIVTTLALLLFLFFIVSEIVTFRKKERHDAISVYTNIGETMDINFRLSMLELPCEAINVDVVDSTDEDKIALQPKVFKTSFRANWDQIIEKARQPSPLKAVFKRSISSYDEEKRLWDTLRKKTISPVSNRGCGSCFEGERFKGQCCNSCYQLKLAFAENNLDPEDALKYTHCLEDSTQGHEGCLVHGTIKVQMGKGNFHIAVGESHNDGGKHHHHWSTAKRKLGFNATHYIHHLSFGEEFPGIVNPLDGQMFVDPDLGQIQYFISVVPTNATNKGKEIRTNQFSVSNHYRKIDLQQPHIPLPGVFFKYDISALQISIQTREKPFFHLVTRIFAVIGGIWVVIGLFYRYVKMVVEYILSNLKN